MLEQFPELASHLQGADATSMERGAISGNRALWRVYRGRVVLVGDASGTVDAITGDGLSVSFRQALALSSAFEIGDLSYYAAAHRRLAMRPLVMSSLLLSLDKYPRLRKRALRALAGDPKCLEGLLAVHTGSRVTPHFFRRRMLPVTLQLFKDSIS
jgi:flavin-dependent dehydrogenase